jgi:hypothetical protein
MHHVILVHSLSFCIFFFRADYWRNPDKNEDTDKPISIRNVICFFDSLDLAKTATTSKRLIPAATRGILKSQQSLIFTTFA